MTLTPALARPYDKPYAVVERGDASEVRKEMPVAIMKIDGVSTRDPRKPDPVTPGKHRLMLHFESTRGTFRPAYKELELDLAPCNRYRVVTKYASKLGPDWEAVVTSERDHNCERRSAKGR